MSSRSLLPPPRLSGLLAATLSLALLPALPTFAASNSLGARIAQQGINGVPACASCHGQHGQGNIAAGFPRLAGLGKDYLLEQLNLYANGKRQNAIMGPFAGKLSPPQRRAVASYFARLPGAQSAGLQPVKTVADTQAKQLLTQGDWSRNLPACFACHGPVGVGVSPHFPPLIGQPTAYLATQLTDWRNGKRSPGAGEMMSFVAEKLTPDEVTALAHYLGRIALKKPSSTQPGGTP